MIDMISKSHLSELLQVSSGPCVSIFMPTHHSRPQTLQDPTRLKNLLRQVTQDLTAKALHAHEISNFLEPVNSLLGDHQFWQHQGDGLALFLSPQLFRFFRVPAEFQESAIVADRFQLKSILPLLTGDGRFYVLSLSQNHVHLFLATRDKIRERPLEGVPKSLKEALSSGPPATQLQTIQLPRQERTTAIGQRFIMAGKLISGACQISGNTVARSTTACATCSRKITRP